MKDTIAALISAEGTTDIVRASGDGILELCSTEFSLPQKPTFYAHPVTLCIRTHWGEVDFRGVALLFRKNRSYTKEEMVELHLGRGLGGAVLRRLFEGGVRHAKAGEFTMRAFLNGRITLAQAEAINALVR
ncbi:MAG: tRNA uridine-5-carboxymethylaminomethyl(34) synthesis GTPase MnmE, partial [Planctomycetota bacterium]